MSNAHTLWYEVTDFFAQVHAQCRGIAEQATADALQAQLNHDLQAASGSPATRGAASVPVVDMDVALEDILTDEADNDLIAIRSSLRTKLTELKAVFGRELNEHETYHALLPMVIYVDELLRVATHGKHNHWEPLQSELYNIDNGGELFYTCLLYTSPSPRDS